MGEACCPTCYVDHDCSALRWQQPAAELLRSGDAGARDAIAGPSRTALGQVQQAGDMVSARMRLLYDYRAPAGTRWSPTAEQLRELLALFHIGGVRTPTTAQISRITARLRAHGRIEGRNVFYWFQNQKARERKRRLQLLQPNVAASTSATFHQPSTQGAAALWQPHLAANDGGRQVAVADGVTHLRGEHICNANRLTNAALSPLAREGPSAVLDPLPRYAAAGSRPMLHSMNSDTQSDTGGGRPADVIVIGEDEKSEVSDAAEIFHVGFPDLQRPVNHTASGCVDMDTFPSCGELAHSRFQDFDEIDSIADMASTSALQLAHDGHRPGAVYSHPSSFFSLQCTASIADPARTPTATLPLFPLSPTCTTTSSSTDHPASSYRHYHGSCPNYKTFSTLDGHPHASSFPASAPASSCSNCDSLLELKLL
ncbi:hypothetical protein L7F22_004831 [Adiantum nelumboides]|nr:hypothetical protein [Adiantum nelumboides]